MSMYYTCEYCSSNLDHGERCDCQQGLESSPSNMFKSLSANTQADISKTMGKLLTSKRRVKANINY